MRPIFMTRSVIIYRPGLVRSPLDPRLQVGDIANFTASPLQASLSPMYVYILVCVHRIGAV